MSEERKKHISVLKNMLEWMEAASKVASKEERKEAVKYAIASLETDEAYQLEYERTTKNDLGVTSELEKNSKKLEKDFGELDCIDRVELLKAMDTWDKFGYTARYGLERLDKDDKGFVPYVKYEDMVNCVKGMTSVTPQEPRWISVSEKLPKVGQRVIFSMKNDEIYIGTLHTLNNDLKITLEPTGIRYVYSFENVVAWMPLPTPFEPQESEE